MGHWIITVALSFFKKWTVSFTKGDTSCSGWNNNGTASPNQLDADFEGAAWFGWAQFVFPLWISASASAILLCWRWSIVISLWQVFCQECCAVNDRQLLTHESSAHLTEQRPQYQSLGFVTWRHKPAPLWAVSHDAVAAWPLISHN